MYHYQLFLRSLCALGAVLLRSRLCYSDWYVIRVLNKRYMSAFEENERYTSPKHVLYERDISADINSERNSICALDTNAL